MFASCSGSGRCHDAAAGRLREIKSSSLRDKAELTLPSIRIATVSMRREKLTQKWRPGIAPDSNSPEPVQPMDHGGRRYSGPRFSAVEDFALLVKRGSRADPRTSLPGLSNASSLDLWENPISLRLDKIRRTWMTLIPAKLILDSAPTLICVDQWRYTATFESALADRLF